MDFVFRSLRILIIEFQSSGSADFCQCGCRGWCTLYPLLFEVCVNLAAAAAGVLAGSDLGFVICVVDITADWPAYLFATCFRHWNPNMHPCPLCDTTLSTMTSLENITADSGPWNIFTQEQYLKLIASSKNNWEFQ